MNNVLIGMDIAKYYHTLRYLTPTQLYFQLYYKLRARVRKWVGYRPDYSQYRPGGRLLPATSWIAKENSYKGNDEFEFLNVSHAFTGSWDHSIYSDLWRYNLNYMDFLMQPSMTFLEGVKWIDCFIDSIPTNRIASDPYPISLRGINWIKFVSQHYDSFSAEQLQRIDTALYSQYLILSHSTERHLMANHYLENGLSLLFAALYFNDTAFLHASETILRSQLDEQILSDGAHFERSPMYHCVILERLLDCYNIIKPTHHSALSDFLLSKIRPMLGWLETAMLSDGTIPLLNDAALGVAPMPEALFMYARALRIKWDSVCLGESGYRKWVTDCYEVMADVAALGPSYNLGHSHADTFSFVMHVGGKPFVVDTGTSTYAAGERRDYERSTEAHNTVCVSHRNSSQVWGAFRCAQRASVTVIEDSVCCVRASHDGYSSLGVQCMREFNSMDDAFRIVDVLESKASIDAVARFYLAPDVQVEHVSHNRVETSMGVFDFIGANRIEITSVEVSSSYNILHSTSCICVVFDSRLETRILPN